MKTKHTLTISFMVFTIVTYSQAGLIGAYPFNGNANDVSGNGNNGVVSGATLTNDRFGNPNSAYQFDGVNDYIDLGTGINYSSHSISVWIKLDNIPQIDFYEIISGLNDLSYPFTNTEMRVYTNAKPEYILGNSTNYGTVQNSTNTVVLDTMSWKNLIVTYNNSSGKVIMFLNGQRIDSTATSFSPSVNTPKYIGARPYWGGVGGTTFYFKGAIDDLHIYNTAISQQTVDSLYALCAFSLAISGNKTICMGNNTTLNASGATTYSWSNGATTSSITVNPTVSTSYALTGTKSACSKTVSTIITVNALPPIPTVMANTSTLASSSSTGNQWNLNGNTIGGATSQFYNATQEGFYTVCVTDVNGCSSCSAPYNFSTVGIALYRNSKDIIIFPNPFSTTTTIRTGHILSNATITICDSFGRTVRQITGISGQSIVLSRDNLTNGLYIIHLTDEIKIISPIKLLIVD